MSYGNYDTVIDFDNSMTLITGKNGYGKTTQFIALFYALFGKTYKKNKLASLINNKTSKGMLVDVGFVIGNDTYRVVRGQKPTIFEIYKNAEIVDQLPSSTGYQDYLDNILMINENIFKQLIFLGANVNSTKSFIDLTKAEKEELFQTITDTTIFGGLRDNIKLKVKDLISQRTDLEYKSKVLKELISAEEFNIHKLEQQNALIQQDNSTVITELQNKITEVESTVSKYSEALEKIKEKKTLYDNKKEEFSTINDKLTSIKVELNVNERKLQRILDVEKTFTVCVGCDKLSKVSDVDITEKDVLVSNCKKLEVDISLISEAHTTLFTEIAELTEVFNKGKQLKMSKDNLQQDLIRYNSELSNLLNRQSNIVTIDRSVLESKSTELSESNSSTLVVNESISKYEKLNKLFDNNNIKGLIIKQSLPLLNKYINDYLDQFTEFSFKFNVDNTFNTSIKHNGVTDYEFTSLSNGQSMRLSFSIILAFLKMIESRNGVSTNLLVLDEILDSSLDYVGRQDLLSIISSNFQGKNVFVISHNDDVIANEFFSKHLAVSIDNSFSKIEQKLD